MHLELTPLSEQYHTGFGSDITELTVTRSGLRIVISTSKTKYGELFLEVFFRDFRGFRYLDESDLPDYFEAASTPMPHHVYEVTAGGWLRGEPQLGGILLMSGPQVHNCPEYFIATANHCLNVLGGAPLIRELSKH